MKVCIWFRRHVAYLGNNQEKLHAGWPPLGWPSSSSTRICNYLSASGTQICFISSTHAGTINKYWFLCRRVIFSSSSSPPRLRRNETKLHQKSTAAKARRSCQNSWASVATTSAHDHYFRSLPWRYCHQHCTDHPRTWWTVSITSTLSSAYNDHLNL